MISPLLIGMFFHEAMTLLNDSIPYNDDTYFAENDLGPMVTKHSHFQQQFRLGYKLHLMCEAEGEPRPRITWYKNGAELPPVKTFHLREWLFPSAVRSIMEVDPAGVGDAGHYACLAANQHGYHLKTIKVHFVL